MKRFTETTVHCKTCRSIRNTLLPMLLHASNKYHIYCVWFDTFRHQAHDLPHLMRACQPLKNQGRHDTSESYSSLHYLQIYLLWDIRAAMIAFTNWNLNYYCNQSTWSFKLYFESRSFQSLTLTCVISR